MPDRTSVLVVDDHPVVRQGLRAFLELQPDLEVVGEAADGNRAVVRAAELQPDVVLLDLVMPGGDGISAISGIRSASPSTRVLVLTSFDDEGSVLPAIQAGAAGYLVKDVPPDELAAAIRAVARGQSSLHPAAASRLVHAYSERPHGRPERLTARELEVLRLLARGQANKQIARQLSVSEKTVKTHVSSILAKLGVTDRTQAALYALKAGLADLDPLS